MARIELCPPPSPLARCPRARTSANGTTCRSLKLRAVPSGPSPRSVSSSGQRPRDGKRLVELLVVLDKQRACPELLQDVFDLAPATRSDRCRCRSCPCTARRDRCRPFRPVFRQHRDDIAARDSRLQRARARRRGRVRNIRPSSPNTRCLFACGAAPDGSPKPGRARGTVWPACCSQRRRCRWRVSGARLSRIATSFSVSSALARRSFRCRARAEIELLDILLLRQARRRFRRRRCDQAP